MSYLARLAVDALATPVVAALLLILAAAILWVRGRRTSAGALALSAGLLVYLLSLAPVGDALLRPLERQYSSPEAGAGLPSVPYVVVLGSRYTPSAGLSPVAALDGDGLARIVEGVRVLRRLPGAHLVLSGGAPPGREPSAHGYARLARDLGVDADSLIVLDTPLDTAEEARAIAATLGSQPFLLVTSAWHMPRAMRLMQRARLHAVALPTGQQAGSACGAYGAYLGCLLPGASGLRNTERAIHEYLGLAALDLGLE
jgi:uncharacterized SAM-binding protein YcdF (DUF218 family)